MRNAIERAVILSPGLLIEAGYFADLVLKADHVLGLCATVSIAELADEHIRRVLARTTRLEDAAEILGIDAAALHRRRRKWQMEAMEPGDFD